LIRSGRRGAKRLFGLGMAAGFSAAAYMTFEAQWLAMRETTLDIPGLPADLEGLSILHLSDVHAGQPGLNLWTLSHAVSWARARDPDLVVLTGDIVGAGHGARRCVEILSQLRPRLGMFAVSGNHEYGLSKNPFAHRPQIPEWADSGIRMLRDECVAVTPQAGGARLVVCGADYLTGGHRMRGDLPADGDVSLLLIHRPPVPGDGLEGRYTMAFAGHTHGGQIRVPTPWGKVRVHREKLPVVDGIHRWGDGWLAVSAGIGTTFLPFRLATRPEVLLHRLCARRPAAQVMNGLPRESVSS
jgi:predicted MPP superfamily phosphohydrolase